MRRTKVKSKGKTSRVPAGTRRASASRRAMTFIAPVLVVLLIAVAGYWFGVHRQAHADTVATDTIGSDSDAGTDGTGTTCTSYWKWHVYHPFWGGGYSEVEWTSNPCGFQIQDRSYCNSPAGAYWTYSGIVKSTYLWDRATCKGSDFIIHGQEHFRAVDGSWSSWKNYWND